MKTLRVDSSNRIRLPDARPKQVFSYENHGNGIITLTQVKARSKPAFPKGSLTKYFSGKLGRERDQLETALLRGCVQGPGREIRVMRGQSLLLSSLSALPSPSPGSSSSCKFVKLVSTSLRL